MTRSKTNDVQQSEPATGRKQGKPELLQVLRRDHERIRDLFQRIERSPKHQVEMRKEMFTVLEQELLFHMEAEERFFYTALEQHEETRAEALESYEEHLVARTLIGTFTSLAADDERWPAKMKVLDHMIRHHLEEEEKVLFELACQVLNDEQMRGILEKIEDLRRDPRSPEGALRPTDLKDTR